MPRPVTAASQNRRSITSRMFGFFTGGGNGANGRPQSGHEHQRSGSVPMLHLTEADPATRPRADTNTTTTSTGAGSTEGERHSLFLSRSRSPLGVPIMSANTNASSASLAPSAFSHNRNRSGSSLNTMDPSARGHLTSPSTSSISSPLVHTVTRTDFRFPKAGPTPDQLKFLSSRETLGRFGVPFGEEAERSYPSERPPPFQASTSGEASGSGGAGQQQLDDEDPIRMRARPASWVRNLTRPFAAEDEITETTREPATPADAEAEAEAVDAKGDAEANRQASTSTAATSPTINTTNLIQPTKGSRISAIPEVPTPISPTSPPSQQIPGRTHAHADSLHGSLSARNSLVYRNSLTAKRQSQHLQQQLQQLQEQGPTPKLPEDIPLPLSAHPSIRSTVSRYHSTRDHHDGSSPSTPTMSTPNEFGEMIPMPAVGEEGVEGASGSGLEAARSLSVASAHTPRSSSGRSRASSVDSFVSAPDTVRHGEDSGGASPRGEPESAVTASTPTS
ncbi:hypothetical protein DL93DRAFT_424494 [Clavulina sp. PMI_390]|nr:hypothetical protein DL93DRAFT_424494 [Clavulina sp. PMI_390]